MLAESKLVRCALLKKRFRKKISADLISKTIYINPDVLRGLMFSLYKKIDSLYWERYGVQAKKYPYAFFVLDKMLRMDLVGKKDLVIRDLNYYSRFSAKKFLVRCVQKLCFFPFLLCYRKRAVLINVPKFYDVGEVVEEGFSAEGWRCFRNPRVLNFLCGTVCSGRLELNLIFKKYLSDSGGNFLDENLLLRLNGAVEKEVRYFSDLLKKLRVQVLFVQGDSAPSERVLCEAAKAANCRVIVLAHGYVQSPSLITIAPVYGDQLCVWTEQQRNDLKSAVESTTASKIRYCGSFFRKRGRKFRDASLSALIALEGLPIEQEKQDFYLKVLNDYSRAMRERGFFVKVRPHPKEKSEIVEQISSLFPNTSLSLKETALEAIGGCDIILAPNSSILIQALDLGKHAFQIS